MDDKAQLKKELLFILGISEKYNLRDDRVVARINQLLESRADLNTSLGKQYRERLRSIQQGTNDEKCFICKRNSADDRVICVSCMQKYSNGNKHIYGQQGKTADSKTETANPNTARVQPSIKAEKHDSEDAARIINQDILHAVEQEKDKIMRGVKTVGEKGKKFADEHDLKGKAEDARKQAKGASKKALVFWGKLSKRNKIIIIAVCLLFIIGGAVRNKNDETLVNNGSPIMTSSGIELDYCPNPSGKVDEKKAEEILYSIYPESDGWEVTLLGPDEWQSYQFWTPVGRTADLAEMLIKDMNNYDLNREAFTTEKCYRFHVHSVVGPGGGIAWVNTDGRVVAFGTLPGFPDASTNYRVR